MKRKMTALALSMCMMISSVSFIYADDTTASVQEQTEEKTTEEEKATEPKTEAPTEKTTEKTTEKQTEATTAEVTTKKEEVKTEATTSSTTTTTKKTTNNDKNVKESKDISIKTDDTKSLSSYVSGSALDARDFSWDTSDSSIATVNSSGKVTAKKKGTCTITATANDGGTKYTYTFNITVKTSSSSSSSSKTKTFNIDVDDEKDLYDYVDDDYSASKYTWKSSNTKYVTVSSKGVAKGKSEGTATVTATYDDEDLEYRFKITVGDDDDSSSHKSSSKVSEKTDWDIYVGTGDKVDISDILEDDPDEYDWDVKDEDIAEIDEDKGVIRGLEEGKTDIEAEGDEDYTFTVHVDDKYSTDSITIKGDDTKDLDKYLDDDADEYSFKSDRKAVATVNSKGEVTGVANGIATIICEHDDGDIIQIFVTVSGISSTTTTTTRETTTETTTSAKVTQTTTKAAAVSFNDISHRAWAIDSIKAMASKGYIVGVGANKFSPDANCKRCDFTIVLIKMLGLDDSDADVEYDDISSKAYYYDYAITALANGIEAGVKNNNFRPDDYITREEVMVMVYKGLVKVNGSMNTDTSVLNKFTDSSAIAAENREAVAALINSGAISGTSDTTLEPKAKITRAQMAVIMNKVDQIVNK